MADGPAGFTQDFSCPALLRIPLRFRSLRTWGFHPLWPYFPACHPHSLLAMTWSYNPIMALLPQWFGLFPVRSPLLGESLLFSLPAGTKMFQFPAFASDIHRMTGLQPAGLSHSEISGSKVICTSPKLIAAYHVLHRLLMPRHPSCALLSLTKILKNWSYHELFVSDSTFCLSR